MIVIDASVVVWLLARRESPVGTDLLAFRETWAAPSHIDLEVLSALRRYVALGRMTAGRADNAVEDFASMPVERYEPSPMLEESGSCERTSRPMTPPTWHWPRRCGQNC